MQLGLIAMVFRFGYIGILVIFTISFLASFYFLQESIRFIDLSLNQEAGNLARIERVRVFRGAITSYLRSFLFTGDQTYLDARESYVRSLDQEMEDLKTVNLAPEVMTKLSEVIQKRREMLLTDDQAIRLKFNGASDREILDFFNQKVEPARREAEEALSTLAQMQKANFEKSKALANRRVSMSRREMVAVFLFALLGAVILGWLFSKRQSELFQKLERAVRARDEMVGVISHELKNPLTALGTGVELAQKFLPHTPQCAGTIDRLERLRPSLLRMSRLISDLLDVTRIEAGKLEVNARACDLSAIVQEVLRAHSAAAEAKNIRLDWRISPQCREVYCDPDRIVQVFANLLGNAIKFVDPGGSVLISAEKKNFRITVQVRDTGKGIPQKDLPYIFDRYWQAKETALQGTGLGLAISKGIIEAHGGKIWVESREGSGSTFYFTLASAESAVKPLIA